MGSRSSTEQIGNSISRRLSWLRLVVLGLAMVIAVRVFYIQVIRHNHYNQLAQAEHQKKYALPAQRGTIYFQDAGKPVPAVLNTKAYIVYADPTIVKDRTALARILSHKLQLNYEEVKLLLGRKKTKYVVIKKRVSETELKQLYRQRIKLTGVGAVAISQRTYPEGGLAAQTLGFVNDEGSGQYGIEEYLDKQLTGTAGEVRAITDVNGVPLSINSQDNVARQPVDGQSVVLTIDRNIQAKAEELLAAQVKKLNATKGSVLVLDPNSGAILAMANVPSFEPATYFKVTDDAYEKFRNRVVTDPYEPGSVVKPLVIGAGLDLGVISLNSSYQNQTTIQIDDSRVDDVLKLPGQRNTTDILVYSLNTGAIWVLQQMGGGSINDLAKNRLYDYYVNRFGFGQRTGIEQPGELPGLIYKPTDEQGNRVRYANMVFGQGLQISMIQEAAAFAAATNDGSYYQPHLVAGTVEPSGQLKLKQIKPLRRNVLKPEVVTQVNNLTHQVALKNPYGALLRKGYRVGSKTGTAQLIDPKTGKYTFEKTTGSLIGYGGDKKPKYVIMVRVDDGSLAPGVPIDGAHVAPVFAGLSNWLIDYYGLQPAD